MADQPGPSDVSKPDDKDPVGKGEGGADSSGSGNILAGVQPKADSDSAENERRDA